MRSLVIALCICGAASVCSGADVYPSKPVRLVAPFATGGSVDITSRIIGQRMSEQMSQPVVVENRPGASGTIANAYVAKSPPDGYTLMLMDTSTTMAPSLYKSLSFDVLTDFTPISQIVRSPQVFVVNPGLNVKTVKEFIALAKASPGKLNYASAGAGSSPHLIVELFKLRAGVDIVHIPFKGGGEMLTAVMGGQVSLMTAGIATVLPLVNSGKLVALAITSDGARSPMMPDVPSMSEAGVAGMTLYAWHGLVGPGGMPPEVVAKLNTEVVKALADPSVRDRLHAQGAEIVGGTPADFSSVIRSETQRWADVVKSAGISSN